MKRSWIALLVGIVAVAGWFLFRGDRDVRAIQRAFGQLTEVAQWEQRDDPLRAGLAAHRVLGFCVRDIVFNVRDVPYRFSHRNELLTAIAHARTRIDRLSIDVTDSELALGPDRRSAEMFVTARITVQYTRDTSSDLRSVKLLWEKTEAGWRLAQVESFETIDGS